MLNKKKIELLAPAGSWEAFQAAIHNGADAIYMAGPRFGARAFAKNFDMIALKEAVDYAHLYGVRVYITVNTLIYDDEFAAIITYVDDLVELGVDALIIQDLGLLQEVKHRYPSLELHASTQMHIHNENGFQYLHDMGIKRAVVARECTIEEIREFSKIGIDLEVFVQGALCIAYSGQCLMSSYLKGRSGNRGECAQHCRMVYSLKEDDKVIAKEQYLLSPKDLYAIEHVKELIEAGIHSFKLEGRMKRPEYVAQVVKMYRKAIDYYFMNQVYHELKTDELQLRKIFNRDFTKGHLFKAKGTSLMNYYRPNHVGVPIGKVTKVTKDKIQVLLSADLSQGDGVRILQKNDEGFTVAWLYKDGLLVNKAFANDVIELDKKSYIEVGATLVKTSDVVLMKELEQAYASEPRKVDVSLYAYFAIGEVAYLSLSDGERSVEVYSDWVVEASEKHPMSEEKIKEQLMKFGSSPFVVKDLQVDLADHVFLSIKLVNELRRSAIEKLMNARIQRAKHERMATPIEYPTMKQTQKIMVVIDRKEQYEALKDQKVDGFIVSDIVLYEDLKTDERVLYQTPRVMRKAYPQNGVNVISEVGGLTTQATISDYSMNVVNYHSIEFLANANIQCIVYSKECSMDEMITSQQNYFKKYHVYPNTGFYVYDYPELMVMEYCPVNALKKDDDKVACTLCKQNHHYTLVDVHQEVLHLQGDQDCNMHIMTSKPHIRINEIKALQQKGVTNFLLRFSFETAEQMKQIINRVLEEVHS